jgi:hypothetical protein
LNRIHFGPTHGRSVLLIAAGSRRLQPSTSCCLSWSPPFVQIQVLMIHARTDNGRRVDSSRRRGHCRGAYDTRKGRSRLSS